MLENMSANQRLILAIVLSFIFFVGYSSIFPPKQQVTEHNTTKNAHGNVNASASEQTTMTPSHPVVSTPDVRHAIRSTEMVQDKDATTLVHVEAEHFSLRIDTLGRIASKVLKDKKFDVDDQSVELIAQRGAQPLFIRFADPQLNEEAMRTPYRATKRTVQLQNGASERIVLEQKLTTLTVTKELDFYSDGHYDIFIRLSRPARYFVYAGQHAEHNNQMMMAVSGAMVYDNKEQTTIFEDEDVEARSTFKDVQLLSAFDMYFAAVIYGLHPDTIVNVERDRESNPVAYLELSDSFGFHGYIGPKDYRHMNSIDPVLVNAIEFGWFTWAAVPLFKLLLWLHGIFGNWGWSIVALVILIRLVLYPLTQKGMVSMQRMKDVAPKLKEIREKHKGDPQRMNAAMMELYKKHNVNPMGGCLPLLLQLPVFFTIYRVLLNAVELQGAEWILWIDDLSRMDPTFILPILMGGTMFLQQRMTPTNFTDPMQEKIFKYLPVVFTFFFVTFPAGLVLYWLTNNLLSIAQQYSVNRQYAAIKASEVTKDA